MMKHFSSLLLVFSLFFAGQMLGQNTYKCQIQMTNYTGQGAYLVVSLINPTGGYEKTLYVLGNDPKWYDSLKKWFGFFQKSTENIDAITGASITQGERKTLVLPLEEKYFNKGYSLRFETAVEDKNYYTTDAQVPLTHEALATKTEGTGYIRYIRWRATTN